VNQIGAIFKPSTTIVTIGEGERQREVALRIFPGDGLGTVSALNLRRPQFRVEAAFIVAYNRDDRKEVREKSERAYQEAQAAMRAAAAGEPEAPPTTAPGPGTKYIVVDGLRIAFTPCIEHQTVSLHTAIGSPRYIGQAGISATRTPRPSCGSKTFGTGASATRAPRRTSRRPPAMSGGRPETQVQRGRCRMYKTAAEPEPARELVGVNIGEFQLDSASGTDWTYRMYLHGHRVKVHRVFPDPVGGRGIAEATHLDQYEAKRATFSFPADWSANNNANLAEAAIVDAYKRATEPVRSSIRFGSLVLVMNLDPGMGVVRVEAEPEGEQPQWAATLSALHKDYMQVQVAWSAPNFGHVFGADPEAEPGRGNRLRLARASSALWRSVNRQYPALLRQVRPRATNERSGLLNA
jgi:hypothetical protein